MHPLERVARMAETATVREVVIEMSRCALGAACMVDAGDQLLGILTDGDIRRLLAAEDLDLGMAVAACMTRDPITIQKELTLGEAVRLMESRSSQISVLPVVDAKTGILQGLFRLHDAYQPSFS
jgi:arabinose-5-phosphate isomerase